MIGNLIDRRHCDLNGARPDTGNRAGPAEARSRDGAPRLVELSRSSGYATRGEARCPGRCAASAELVNCRRHSTREPRELSR